MDSMKTISVSVVATKQALRQNAYFSNLNDSGLELLCQGTHLRHYERGEVVFWEGDPCAGLHIVQNGSVKLFKTSPQGRELIIKVFEEGATFNEVPVFDNGLNPVNAGALETSTLWVVEAEAIHTAMLRHPEICKAIIANLSNNLRMLMGMVEELSFYQVTNRLARLISQLPEDQLVGEASQRITQDQLAARLGTVREVVARSLRVLERSGAIRVNRRQIEVVDERTLLEWAAAPELS
jgi:CRP/FNR family transcriptional regulator